MAKLLTVISLILLVVLSVSGAQAKPFKKALVIGGGGITPGIALGMIAGAKAAGYESDVVIASCGSSLGATLYGSFSSPQEALKYAKSEKFYKNLKSLVKLDSRFAFGLQRKLNGAYDYPKLLPRFFDGTILDIPSNVGRLLPNEKFPLSENKPRLIIVAARASFGPEHQGKDSGTKPLFRETFITDAETAELLRGFDSPVQKLFPYGRVDHKTEVMTQISLSQAVRASITDPYYINPTRIGNSYYWGGAIDLFPIETAQLLADEVLVNFPSGLYSAYEDLAISSAFGFAQSDRTTEASRHNDVKWIDSSESILLAMDPVVFGAMFINKIPNTHARFADLVHRQYQFGYQRAVEAVRLQKNKNNVRTHLRHTRVGAK